MKKLKIEDQVLSREQMTHLEELGVDTSDASMAYYNISREGEPDRWLLGIANVMIASAMLVNGLEEAQPAYTIGDLIEKLPKDVLSFSLVIQYEQDKVGYYETSCGNIDVHHEEDISNNPIDGLYNLFCWVAENHKELIE